MRFLEGEYDFDSRDVVSSTDDMSLWSASFGMKLLEVVEMRPGMNVLDVGSGPGFPVVELSQRLGDTCRVHAIDPWAVANERTRLKIRTWGITNLDVFDGAAESLPFADGYFHLVTSNNGINNVDDEEKSLSEVSRVCAPGAQVVLTMNLPETFKEFYDVYRTLLRGMNKESEAKALDEHIHHKRKPLAHRRRVIEGAGLRVDAVHEGSFTWRYLDGTAMLNHFAIKLAFLKPWVEILDAEDVPEVMTQLECDLNDIAEGDGEIRLTIPWVCLDCRKPA